MSTNSQKTSMLLKVDGVDGESTIDGYTNWSVVSSILTDIAQPTGSTVAAGGYTIGTSTHADVLVDKFIDKATPILHQLCSTGKPIPEAKLHILRANGDKNVLWLAYQFKKVVISKDSVSTNSGHDRPIETVGIRYAEIHVDYSTGDGNTSTGYSVEAGKKL